MNNNDKRAFTLLEMLVVVLIIGILASVAIPIYKRMTERGKASEAFEILSQIRNKQEERDLLGKGAGKGYTMSFADLGTVVANKQSADSPMLLTDRFQYTLNSPTTLDPYYYASAVRTQDYSYTIKQTGGYADTSLCCVGKDCPIVDAVLKGCPCPEGYQREDGTCAPTDISACDGFQSDAAKYSCCVDSKNRGDGMVWNGTACVCPDGMAQNSNGICIPDPCATWKTDAAKYACCTNHSDAYGRTWSFSAGDCICPPNFTWNPATHACEPTVSTQCCSQPELWNSFLGICDCGTEGNWVEATCSCNCNNGKIWNAATKKCECPSGLYDYLDGCHQCPQATPFPSNNYPTDGTKCCQNDGMDWTSSGCKCPAGQIVSNDPAHCCPTATPVWNGTGCQVCPVGKFPSSNYPNDGAKCCASAGMTWDVPSSSCLAASACPAGKFPSANFPSDNTRCCPSAGMNYNTSTSSCEAACPTGKFPSLNYPNDATRCCSSSGMNYNTTTSACEAVCPAGQFPSANYPADAAKCCPSAGLNYNTSTSSCEAACAAGKFPSANYPEDKNKCCDAKGLNWNDATSSCVAACPSGTFPSSNYPADIGKCCPASGMNYNTTTNRCEAICPGTKVPSANYPEDATKCCPSAGMNYNDTTKTCDAACSGTQIPAVNDTTKCCAHAGMYWNGTVCVDCSGTAPSGSGAVPVNFYYWNAAPAPGACGCNLTNDVVVNSTQCCPKGYPKAISGHCCLTTDTDWNSATSACIQCPANKPFDNTQHKCACPSPQIEANNDATQCCTTDKPYYVNGACAQCATAGQVYNATYSICCNSTETAVPDASNVGHCCPTGYLWDTKTGACATCPSTPAAVAANNTTFVAGTVGWDATNKRCGCSGTDTLGAGSTTQCCSTANPNLSSGHCCPTTNPSWDTTALKCTTSTCNSSTPAATAANGPTPGTQGWRSATADCGCLGTDSKVTGSTQCCPSGITALINGYCCTSSAPNVWGSPLKCNFCATAARPYAANSPNNADPNKCCISSGQNWYTNTPGDTTSYCCNTTENFNTSTNKCVGCSSPRTLWIASANKCDCPGSTATVSTQALNNSSQCCPSANQYYQTSGTCCTADGTSTFWNGSSCVTCSGSAPANASGATPVSVYSWNTSTSTCGCGSNQPVGTNQCCPSSYPTLTNGHCCSSGYTYYSSGSNGVCCSSGNSASDGIHCCPTGQSYDSSVGGCAMTCPSGRPYPSLNYPTTYCCANQSYYWKNGTGSTTNCCSSTSLNWGPTGQCQACASNMYPASNNTGVTTDGTKCCSSSGQNYYSNGYGSTCCSTSQVQAYNANACCSGSGTQYYDSYSGSCCTSSAWTGSSCCSNQSAPSLSYYGSANTVTGPCYCSSGVTYNASGTNYGTSTSSGTTYYCCPSGWTYYATGGCCTTAGTPSGTTATYTNINCNCPAGTVSATSGSMKYCCASGYHWVSGTTCAADCTSPSPNPPSFGTYGSVGGSSFTYGSTCTCSGDTFTASATSKTTSPSTGSSYSCCPSGTVYTSGGTCYRCSSGYTWIYNSSYGSGGCCTTSGWTGTQCCSNVAPNAASGTSVAATYTYGPCTCSSGTPSISGTPANNATVYCCPSGWSYNGSSCVAPCTSPSPNPPSWNTSTGTATGSSFTYGASCTCSGETWASTASGKVTSFASGASYVCCPSSGTSYTSGGTCYKCPSGQQWTGSTMQSCCSNVTTPSSGTSTVTGPCYCSNGVTYNSSGTNVGTSTTAGTTYFCCPTNYTYSGGTCVAPCSNTTNPAASGATMAASTVTGTCYCSNGVTYNSSGTNVGTSTTAGTTYYCCPGSWTYYGTGQCCVNASAPTFSSTTGTVGSNGFYGPCTCGGTAFDRNAATVTSFSSGTLYQCCPSGTDHFSSNTCYKCPTGQTYYYSGGDKCCSNVSLPTGSTPNQVTGPCTCTNMFSSSGTQVTSGTAGTTYYCCPSGWTYNGSSCVSPCSGWHPTQNSSVCCPTSTNYYDGGSTGTASNCHTCPTTDGAGPNANKDGCVCPHNSCGSANNFQCMGTWGGTSNNICTCAANYTAVDSMHCCPNSAPNYKGASNYGWPVCCPNSTDTAYNKDGLSSYNTGGLCCTSSQVWNGSNACTSPTCDTMYNPVNGISSSLGCQAPSSKMQAICKCIGDPCNKASDTANYTTANCCTNTIFGTGNTGATCYNTICDPCANGSQGVTALTSTLKGNYWNGSNGFTCS